MHQCTIPLYATVADYSNYKLWTCVVVVVVFVVDVVIVVSKSSTLCVNKSFTSICSTNCMSTMT